MTYSLDFRKKVFSMMQEHQLTFREAAKRYGVSTFALLKWKRNINPITKRHRPATKIDMEALKQDVERYPDKYLRERAKTLGVSKSAIWKAFKRLNITVKKKETYILKPSLP